MKKIYYSDYTDAIDTSPRSSGKHRRYFEQLKNSNELKWNLGLSPYSTTALITDEYATYLKLKYPRLPIYDLATNQNV
jgi:hypothetical protein